MKILCILMLFATLTSCINNDIPYPIIKGEVVEFKAKGEVSASTIDPVKRTIQVVLSDTVDIQRVSLSKFKISEGARAVMDSTSILDLSSELTFTITTYQNYPWKITATQPIERYFKVENQVGNSNIDTHNKIVVAYVPKSQDLTQINVLSVKLGPANATTLPNPMETRNFSRSQTFLVKYFNTVEEWKIFIFKEE